MSTLYKPFDYTFYPAVQGHAESGGYSVCGYVITGYTYAETDCHQTWPSSVVVIAGQIVVVYETVCTLVEVPVYAYQCVYVPYSPAVEAAPARTVTIPRLGWDAGAQSTMAEAGNCELEFSIDPPMGVYIGLTASGGDVTDVSRFRYAVYLYQANYAPQYVLIVDGGAVTAAEPFDSTTVFKIQRIGTTVTFLVDDTPVHVEEDADTDTLSAGTSVYASGDAVPEIAGCC